MRSNTSVRWAKTGYIVLSLCLCAFGAALALWPDLSLQAVTVAVGAILICFGAVKIWGYLTKDLYRLAFRHGLATGILAIAVGAVLILKGQIVASILCLVLGITVMLDGLTKIEMSVEARQFGLGTWWIVLTVGILTGGVGFLLILRPWEGAQAMAILLGAALFVEGLLNFITALTALRVARSDRDEIIQFY